MSCTPGYKLVGGECVLLPKISPWGKEPFIIKVYHPGSDRILEISVSMDMKGENISFKAKSIEYESSV
jgi:hypothetical protein